MKTLINSQIHVTDPSTELLNWCMKNLILMNPDYEKKLRMGLWLGNTPEKLYLYEMHGNELVLPFGTLRTIYRHIMSSECEAAFKPPLTVKYRGTPVPLYDYQQEAVDKLHRSRYGILQSPAGSGKTQMGIALVIQYQESALWLTHTADLLRQSKERAEQYIDKSQIGTITEGRVNIREGITFATIQTMSKLDLDQYKDMWDVVIVDECHHVAGTPTRMTQFSKVLNRLNARHKYGLSATVHRADGMIKATYAYLGEIVHTVPEEAVEDKIMKVGILPMQTNVCISSECQNPDGTLNYTKMITYLTESAYRNQEIMKLVEENKEHSCLILSDRIEHLENMKSLLPPVMKAKAVMITGKMTSKAGKKEREEALELMRTGQKKYLFATYSLAKEGLDIPRLDRLFMTTPVKDEAIVIQSIGRIARTYPGKKDPVAYDFIDLIPFCKRAWKERCKHYKKTGAYML